MRVTEVRAGAERAAAEPADASQAPNGAASTATTRTGLAGPLVQLVSAPEARRVVAFLFAGGVSTLVTLSVTSLMTEMWGQRFLWSAIVGTELGVLVQFVINDRLAFHDLAGHRRSLPARLARYHLTCAGGQTIILLVSLVLHDVVHWRAVFAQAVPIVIVTAFNFLMHRFWTYRGVRQTVLPTAGERG